MKIYHDISKIKISNPIATVGVFDGVHLGHQQIFLVQKEMAKANNGETLVITFWPHPRMVLQPGANNMLMINSLDEKVRFIESMGIDHLLFIEFTKGFSQMSSLEFINEYLCRILKIKGLIMGFDHKFGKDRLDDFAVLKKIATENGFLVEKIHPLKAGNHIISSTTIRNAIIHGDIKLANSCLGRPFSFFGTVVQGEKVGRQLGFPTANLVSEFVYQLIPGNGVYAVKVFYENFEYLGMLNIGNRPTLNLNEAKRTVEVHLIGFEGDLYGKKLHIHFLEKIRDEKKFQSLSDLKTQLVKDKSIILSFLEK
ncbi:MAG: bifunctional riboflavin kinase/FAD synthetase [Bacteroidales bacterium]